MKIEINNLTKEYDELIALNGVNITQIGRASCRERV